MDGNPLINRHGMIMISAAELQSRDQGACHRPDCRENRPEDIHLCKERSCAQSHARHVHKLRFNNEQLTCVSDSIVCKIPIR